MRKVHVLLVIGFSLAWPLAMYGQLNTGGILGTVKDASGAVVAGADVSVKNAGTNFTREVKTDAKGDYAVPDLEPGDYSVSVRAQGFQEAIHSGLQLVVNQLLRVDVTLTVGSIQQKVEVTGQPPLVQTDTSSVGQVIAENQVENLPLNGRNFLQLALLSPGTNDGGPGNAQASRDIGGVSLAANGARTPSNNYMMDGMDNNLAINGYIGLMPSVDTIQEFKVQTSTYSAEFGRSAGAQINLVSKSGTNQWHGSAYEFLRNDHLDAADFLLNSTPGGQKQQLKQNQFGATIGGPVSIPHVYNGKDKTFFFFGYEGFRIRRGQTFKSTVPTAAEKQGNFTALSTTIYNPLLPWVNGKRQGFTVPNVVDSNLIISAAKFLEGFVPNPNLPGFTNNFILSPSARTDEKMFYARLDHKISDKDQIWGRFNWFGDVITNPARLGTPAIGSAGLDSGSHQSHYPIEGELVETHMFSPTLLNDFRLGYSRPWWDFTGLNAGHDYTSQAGIKGISTNPAITGFPHIVIYGYNSWGDGSYIPNPNNEESFFVMDHVSWVKGSHNVRAGADNQRYHFDFIGLSEGRGLWWYTGTYSAATNATYGTPFVEFLMGLPALSQDSVGLNKSYIRQTFYNFFIQDDYRATKRLTLNLGLRYENQRPPSEKNGRLTNFDFQTGQETFCNPAYAPAGYPYGDEKSFDCSGIEPANHDFAPRVGFAYRLTQDSKTVLRGGYGIFFDIESTNPILNDSGNPPFSYFNSFHNNPVIPDAGVDMTNVFQQTPVMGLDPGLSYIPKNFVPGYYQQWNLAVQREITSGFSIDGAYVGAKGTHLIWSTNDNQPLPGPNVNFQASRPYPLFSGIGSQASGAASIYHALQLKAENKMKHGLSSLTSYTWSKSIDNASSPYESPFNPQNTTTSMRGPSDFDQTQRFVQSALYAIPVGRGKAFLGNSSRLTDAALGGWNVGGIYTFGTGFPYTVTIASDEANIGLGGQVPIRLSSGKVANPSVTQWYDPTAFKYPAQYTFGNSGRGILRGPRLSMLDFSVRKTFNLTETQHLDFRAEFFNFLNHPNFGMPDGDIDDGSYGLTSLVGTPSREIQFALRYHF